MYKITITAEVPRQLDVDRLMDAYNGMVVEELFPNGSDFSYDGEPEPDPNAGEEQVRYRSTPIQ